MGHIHTTEQPSKPFNIVAVIEDMIHDHQQLDAFLHQARNSLRETGLLPQDRIWDYLHWRRDLDPSRFDYYHPEFAPLFRRELRDLRHLQQHQPTTPVIIGLTPGVLVGPTPGVVVKPPIVPDTSIPASWTSVVDPPQDPSPSHGVTVPEPGTMTLALAALAVGGAMVATRWLRRRPRCGLASRGADQALPGRQGRFTIAARPPGPTP
jgi:hypothetical protein